MICADSVRLQNWLLIHKTYCCIIEKNQGVFVKCMPPVATKSKKLFLASSSKSRSQLTLMSFERVSLVEYACQI